MSLGFARRRSINRCRRGACSATLYGLVGAIWLGFILRRLVTHFQTAKARQRATAKAALSALEAAAEAAREVVSVEAWVAAARNRMRHPRCSPNVTEYALKWQRDVVGCDMMAWHGRPMFASVWEENIQGGLLPEEEPAATGADFAVNVVVTDHTLRKALEAAATWVPRARALGATVRFLVNQEKAPKSNATRVAMLEAVGEVVRVPPSALPQGHTHGAELQEMLPLVALRHAAGISEGTPHRWHVLVTDDTYLQLEEGVASLQFYNHELPLLMGHVDSGRACRSYGMTDQDASTRSEIRAFATRPAGTAGIILSPAALQRLGAAVLTEECPWPPEAEVRARRWDYALGRCCWTAGVPMLHNPLMLASLDSPTGKAWHMDLNDSPLESLVTVSASEGGAYSYERVDRTKPKSVDTLRSIDHALRFKHDPQLFINRDK